MQKDIDPKYETYKVRAAYDIKAIPNEYGGAWNTDWYIVELLDSEPKSQIKFGSRKRVWEVELSSKEKSAHGLVVPPGHPLDVLYKNEDVTKTMEPRTIMFHAWSKEKVYEYVEAMLRLVVKPELIERAK